MCGCVAAHVWVGGWVGGWVGAWVGGWVGGWVNVVLAGAGLLRICEGAAGAVHNLA